jgi:general secretion pathway protein C
VALLLLVWATLALTELIWAFLPRPEVITPIELNPLESGSRAETAESIDVEAMRSWHLFGVIGEEDTTDPLVPEAVTAGDREGIEKGARDTRLDLKLRGVISATEDGLGYAIIEHRSQQDVYAVGDKLPAGNEVSLAKVMPGSVVLDNSGTYELLHLFEETTLLGQLPHGPTSQRSPPPAKAQENPAAEVQDVGDDVSAVAKNFRRQLYENPESLAEVVRVSAVREDNVLKGYRIDPGKNSAQFTQLGFRAGDVVTRVNGINLDNPGNTMRLYQMMRSASEAIFDLERGGENLTLTVSLDEAPGGG